VPGTVVVPSKHEALVPCSHACRSARIEHPKRIEPQDFFAPQFLTSDLAHAALNLKGIEEQIMLPIRIVAIPTEVAKAVRATFVRLFMDSPRMRSGY